MVQGSENQGGYMNWTPSAMVSALQLPAYLKLKRRHDQPTSSDSFSEQQLYKDNLEVKEAESFVKKKRFDLLSENQKRLMLEHSTDETQKKALQEWLDKQKLSIEHVPKHDANLLDDSDDSLLSSDDEEDEEDQELMRELQKLREENQREQQEDEHIQEAEKLQNALHANPLLNQDDDAQSEASSMTTASNRPLKRKWTSDSIFRNQAPSKPKKRKRFINDTIRSDFHKKFMDSLMK